MHYAISTKILGQTHMWHTQRQAIKLFKYFSIFMGFLNFWTHSKSKQETKINKNKSKAKASKRNMNKQNTWDLCNRYVIKSKKVHTWDKHKTSDQTFWRFFNFYGFLNFWTHSKTEHETKNNKNKSKAKSRERNMNKLSMWDQSDRYATKRKKRFTHELEFKEWYRHRWSYAKSQTSDHQEV